MRKLISNSKFLCSASYAPGSAVRAPTYMNSFGSVTTLETQRSYVTCPSDCVSGYECRQSGFQIHPLPPPLPRFPIKYLPEYCLVHSICIWMKIFFSLYICYLCSTVTSCCFINQCILPSLNNFLLSTILFACIFNTKTT